MTTKRKTEPYTVKTSDGLRDLLIRNGIVPNMDSKLDVALARQVMREGNVNRPSISDRVKAKNKLIK